MLAIANIKAQIFTKITEGPIVHDSCNSYYASWGDYDNDGDIDLYLPMLSGSPTNILVKNYMYQNNCNGDFTQIKAIPGGLVTEPNLGTGSYWIDYDNDGNLDLYVWASRKAEINNSLFKNNGNGSFIKVSNAITSFNKGAIVPWADYDNDGHLDVFIDDTSLFKSDGNGDFIQITPSPLYFDPTKRIRFNGSWADYDNDGYMDLLVITSISTWGWDTYLFMYHNNGNGIFTLDTLAPYIKQWYSNYGCAWADYDNDMDLDLWVNGNSGPGQPAYDHLYQNNGDGTFIKITTGPVVNTSAICQAGAAWADYDNDGDLDLFVPNFGQNLLFDNNADGTFTRNTTEIIVNDVIAESYGACWADYDNDGYMDLFVNNGWANASNFLYKNTIYQNNGNGNHWLKVKCTGIISNRNAIGVRVYAKAIINGNPVWQMREINANTTRGGESGGASGHVVHIGFGNASVIDTLKIVWPASHTTQIFTNVTNDRFIEITEGINNIAIVKPCVPDLPPKNPGFITGKVYNDNDDNCVYDTEIDAPIVNRMIEARPGPYFVLSDNSGNYEFGLSENNYVIKQPLIQNDIWKTDCDSSFSLTVTAGETITGKDFGNNPSLLAEPCDVDIFITYMEIPTDPENMCCCQSGDKPICCDINNTDCCPNIPEEAPTLIGSPCPGYVHQYCLTIINNGNDHFSPNGGPNVSIFELNLNLDVTFLDEVSNPCNLNRISDNPPTWEISNANQMPSGQECVVCIEVMVELDADFPLTTTANANVACPHGTAQDSDLLFEEDACPCDPNDKLTAPKGCGPFGNIDKNEQLTYSIRFQNIGAGPAHNVILRDELNDNLDITSLKILSGSHPVTNVEVIPDNTLILTYEGIELPPYVSDPKASTGYVTFIITPKDNLPDGTAITNQAGIYFDRNDVVLTNTTLNTLYDIPSPVADFEAKHSCTSFKQVYDFTYTGGTSDGATFEWNFGSDATPSVSTDENPTGILFDNTGAHEVSLTVNRYGCISSVTKTIDIINVYCGKNKVLVCHIPPGNPENAHTICISINALPAHLTMGDYIGPCLSNTKMLNINNNNNNTKGEIQFYIFPNPSGNSSTVMFSLPFDDFVSIDIYNNMGIFVKNIYKDFAKGNEEYKLQFDITTLSNGIYYCILNSNSEQKITKFVLIK
jgi:uncharacterized repeat protein (TIGR01451 family)